MAKPFDGVIFDMDGLMMDTESIGFAAFDKAMRECGYSYRKETYTDLIGLDAGSAKRALYKKYGDRFPFETVCRKMNRHEQNHIRKYGIPLKRGILELLTFLERHSIEKGVGTSTAKEKAIKKLTCTSLKRFFTVIVGGDEVDRGKPEPDIFLKVAAGLRVSPARCFVIEDSEPGIWAAFRGGMMPIMIPDFVPPSETVNRLACRILPDHFAVIEFLREILEKGCET